MRILRPSCIGMLLTAATLTTMETGMKRLVLAAMLAVQAGWLSPAMADDLSDCRAATKDADAILAACSRVIEAGKVQDSELSAAHMGRGLALRRKGEFERAIAEYNEAMRLAPESPSGNLGRAGVLVGRAWVFVDLGQPERAIADWDAAISTYDKLIANSPDSAQWPYAGRAGSYANKGVLDRAIADYGESIRIRPADALFYLWRARAYLLKGDVAKAHADATQVISLLEKPAGGHTLRGLAYELAGQLDDALTDHETAVKLDPTLGLAYANRGRVRDAKGERERAAADFAAALQHDPSVPWAFVFSGNQLEQAGNLDRALIEYETALKLDPKALSAIKGRDRVRAALAVAGERK
jgi:tetratricopeptide (TPR) repeat protein